LGGAGQQTGASVTAGHERRVEAVALGREEAEGVADPEAIGFPETAGVVEAIGPLALGGPALGDARGENLALPQFPSGGAGDAIGEGPSDVNPKLPE
jgi:hypothetical protein